MSGDTLISFEDAKQMPRLDIEMRVIRAKLNVPPDWEWCKARVVAPGCVVYEGGIPRTLKSGKRAGQKTLRGVKLQACAVTDTETKLMQRKYGVETGKCPHCFGAGKWKAGANMITRMVTLRECAPCKGTGLYHP